MKKILKSQQTLELQHQLRSLKEHVARGQIESRVMGEVEGLKNKILYTNTGNYNKIIYSECDLDRMKLKFMEDFLDLPRVLSSSYDVVLSDEKEKEKMSIQEQSELNKQIYGL